MKLKEEELQALRVCVIWPHLLDSSLEKALWECGFIPRYTFHGGHWSRHLSSSFRYINKAISCIMFLDQKTRSMQLWRKSFLERFLWAAVGSLHWWKGASTGRELGVRGSPLPMVLFFAVSVTHHQLWHENIKWKNREINNSYFLNCVLF